jgi:putative aldouronate transport system substrate-binding protein
LQCLGGPNVWRETGGKLTRDWETDEFKAAVTFARGLWDAGLVHPDSASLSGSPAGTVFYAGKMAMWITGFNNVPTVWDRAVGSDPGFKPRVVVPFSHDGKAKPVHFLGPGAQALMAVKKGSPERIKQLLGVLNYLAAPFGTQEYLLLNYGVEGVDFAFDGAGNPVPTKQGSQDLNVPWKFAMAPPEALYNATSRDYAPVRHEQQAAILPLGIQNPTIGLYSKTDEAQGGALLLKMFDGINQIIFGQASLSTFDGLVSDWRRNGGDQMRGEYEQAIQASRA